MEFFHSVVSVNLSSVVSIYLLNLSPSVLFLSQSFLVCLLVAMLYHVLWLSVSVGQSYVHVILIKITKCGTFCICCVNFSRWRCTLHASTMTTQCEAFCVHCINFCVCDTHAMLTLTTNQCGARSGLPQYLETLMSVQMWVEIPIKVKKQL